jgi:hypothetical protein
MIPGAGVRAAVRGLIVSLAAMAVHLVPAHAFPTGETLHSGKQGATCSACHSGGVAPTVLFMGPSTVAVGATATYVFEVQSMATKQRAAGLNVADSDGTLGVLPQQGEQLIGGELTHTVPKNNVDQVADWDFTWTAPAAPGAYTLFGAGNSVNLNGQSTGDRASATTFDIMVVGADPPTPTPTATPLPPTATPAPTDTPTRPAGDTPTVIPPGSPLPCVGDCGGDGTVEVNELITGVNIALGNLPVSACPVFDANGDDLVGINELIAAVNNALSGCP